MRWPIGHNAGSEVPAMNLLNTSRQRLLPALIACLVGATWAMPAVSALPLRCYADPVPGEASNNQMVNYNRGLDSQPDPWGSPGAPPIGGAFACSKPGNCDLRTVMEESSTCALLVIKGGNLVYEYYDTTDTHCRATAGPNGPQKLYGVASVAKSIVSTLLGHVWSSPHPHGGFSLDEPVSRFVTGLPPATHLQQVTVAQALTMTSRLKFDDSATCLKVWTVDHATQAAQGKTFLQAASAYADRDFWLWPTRPFQYSGLDSTLVGLTVEALSRRAGGANHLNETLSELIWSKAGMRSQARWKADLQNTPAAFCCFYATARDLGRFGQHVLRNVKAVGNTPDTPIRDWMVKAGREHVRLNRTCRVQHKQIRVGYGYQWWSLSEGEGFAALGNGGQFLHLFPDDDAVVVQLGSWPENWPDRTECDVYAAHRFVVDHFSK